MDDAILERFRQLEEKVKTYHPSLDSERLFAALTFADKAHDGQKRLDGSAFFTHPLAAAEIVAEMGLDEDAIIAALLHDCIEDTGATREEIAKLFGNTVADLVDGITKLTRVHFTTKEQEQMENIRKMLMAMAKDIRVILIKIADRLHNMRTMNYQTSAKQQEKALETMSIYAPIAHRLGMQKIKWELEDLSLLYLDPAGYKSIYDELARGSDSHSVFMDAIQTLIRNSLHEYGIEATVYGRIKHIYSIYRKMYVQNKKISEVFDLYAFRVIVDNITECYTVLGCMHDLFRPVPGRFKDYIANPKPNMYQSLHTTVIGKQGIPFEVQIRTWDMHRTAEYGVAAHWKYKQSVDKQGDEEKFAWIRRLLETQQDSDAQSFFSELKMDMFADEVFVFTPKADVINLPAGATPIDFAYSIHSAIGNTMTGARVNGRLVTFDTVLQNGDIVEILTSPSSKGPSRDWLSIAKSTEARNKIRQWFKKEQREENIIHGKAAFEAEMKHAGLPMSVIAQEDLMPQLLKKVSFGSLNDMYAAIGYGGFTALRAVNRIKDELIRINKQKKQSTELLDKLSSPPKKLTNPVHGVIVEGLDNCLVKFSKCCTPVPGDDIAGFITRGYGVSIHRTDCPNYLNTPDNPDAHNRWVEVSWADEINETYQTAIVLSAKDRSGLVMDVAMTLNALKVNITSMSARSLGNGMALESIAVEVKDLEQLKTVMSRLSMVNGVIDVKRASG